MSQQQSNQNPRNQNASKKGIQHTAAIDCAAEFGNRTAHHPHRPLWQVKYKQVPQPEEPRTASNQAAGKAPSPGEGEIIPHKESQQVRTQHHCNFRQQGDCTAVNPKAGTEIAVVAQPAEEIAEVNLSALG